MKTKQGFIAASSGLLLMCAFLSACSEKQPAAPPPAPPAAVPAAPAAALPPATWNGQWTGPEGTFLRIEGDAAGYQITVSNLDGPRTFAGMASGGQIQFERDGVKELIHASSGADTGMKWLADKTDCLTVKTGEGYCRD